MQVIHEDMKGMNRLGIINDARMKEFDEMCLVQEDKSINAVEKPLEVEGVTA